MVTPYPAAIEEQIQRYYQSLDEKDRRRYAGIEAVKLGYGGVRYISRLLSCNEQTIRLGMQELSNTPLESKRIRKAGGGRKSAFETIPGLDEIVFESAF